MSIEHTTTLGRYARQAFEMRCDGCPRASRTALTQRRARRNGWRDGFRRVAASDRPGGYWLCPDCMKCWCPRLSVQEFIRQRRYAAAGVCT